MIQHLTSKGRVIRFENPEGVYPVNAYQSLVLATGCETVAHLLAERTGRKLEEVRAWEPCCGGGPVAVSLKSLGLADVQASDVNPAALQACRRNAEINGLTVDRVVEASWLKDGEGDRYDLICCNPPCGLTSAVKGVSSPVMRRSVDGGADGMQKTLNLMRQARTRLTPTGSFVLIAVSTTAIGRLVRGLERLFPRSWRVVPGMPVAAPWARVADERFQRLESEEKSFEPLIWRRADGWVWRLSWVIEASMMPDAFPGAGGLPVRPFGYDFATDEEFGAAVRRFSADEYWIAARGR